ncbi:hypothetical protein EG68_07414 [Paragonimus skrjabini miyazakii]|uniref:Glutathione synthetase n=1 Tax=Paragonimus skrjabini miyazakii TaxID=59628 RepID=A0A8S9YU75_9TREM|nr:hypothetical protein EG68_07414 [Paragonimus skrjabini miyazakii]
MLNITPQTYQLAEQFAHLHGILRKTNGIPSTLSCTLLPSPFPSFSLDLAKAVQRDFNLLFHRVACDHGFLNSLMEHVIAQDDYVKHLWNIYERVRNMKTAQNIFLGLNRSDYMLHQEPGCDSSIIERLYCIEKASASPVITAGLTGVPGLSLRQVEFNLMASSFCGLAQRIVEQHRVSLSLCGVKGDQLSRVPDCNSADSFADALWKACELYREHVTRADRDRTESCTVHGAVLMVVAANETNVYDQYALLSRLLLRHPEATVLLRTFEELVESKERLQLDDQSRLFVDKIEVAVIYFRHGYVPEHFPTEEIWELKYELERSMAIKCPCIQYMLANTKLVQAALSKPDQLARFVDCTSPAFSRILSTFAKQYTLSDAFGLSNKEEIAQIVEMCKKNPHLYVLKPQREGGGNNFFDDDLVRMLNKLIEQGDQHSYVIMERLYPFVVENYVLHSKRTHDRRQMVSELGIFGVFIGRGDEVFLNEPSGHLLRTKPIESNEGGIAAGYGFLDSPFLV